MYVTSHPNKYGLLSKVVKSFKDQVVKTVQKEYEDYDFYWQRSFYDHIIRNAYSLENIKEYIRCNPENYKTLVWK